MPNVVNGIKAAVRDGRFTKSPRGPIGKRKTRGGDNGISFQFFIGLEGLVTRLNKIPVGECDCGVGWGMES